MREIKFRVWSADKFAYSDIEGWECFVDCWIHDENLMQFTGLKDKNGKEIYEGDVIKMEEIYTIEYGKYSDNTWDGEIGYGWYLQDIKDKDNVKGLYTYNNMKIIGNKFENPELI